jgi:ParB family transcriptional regulator, chromosome partitioning protein
MPRSSGLGKGLSSIIPSAEIADAGLKTALGAALIDAPITSISPNPNQPRVHFDEESLLELASSIAEMGVLQPILVRPMGAAGTYELIAGERRWRAAQRAGLATIPAIVRTTDDLSSIEQALVENLHRQDLTPLEEAAAYQQLLEDFQLTHEQLSGRVGKSRSAITNTIRLLGLPPAVQHLLADGQLSAGHARALLGTPDRALQEELAREAVAGGWSVRAMEQAVRAGGVPGAQSDADSTDSFGGGGNVDGRSADDGRRGTIDGAGLQPQTRLRPPGLLELEQLLADHLETSVAVQMTAKKGRVVVDFADLADLERLYHRMVG